MNFKIGWIRFIVRNTVIYILYYKEEYLERYLKFTVKILQNHFFNHFEKLQSIEKVTLKHWDLQYTKPIILFISFFVKL